jgi:hypothetical protein
VFIRLKTIQSGYFAHTAPTEKENQDAGPERLSKHAIKERKKQNRPMTGYRFSRACHLVVAGVNGLKMAAETSNNGSPLIFSA